MRWLKLAIIKKLKALLKNKEKDMLYADLYIDLFKKGAKTVTANITDEKVRSQIDSTIEAQTEWAKTIAEANYQLSTAMVAPLKDTEFGKIFQIDRYFK